MTKTCEPIKKHRDWKVNQGVSSASEVYLSYHPGDDSTMSTQKEIRIVSYISDIKDEAKENLAAFDEESMEGWERTFYKNRSIEPETLRSPYNVDAVNKMNIELRDRYHREMESIIEAEYFESGEISKSALYIEANCNQENLFPLKAALLKLYMDNFSKQGREIFLEGILTMFSTMSYDDAYPEGHCAAVALLSHNSLNIRDKAVQAFEKWNSKKGIDVLKHIDCKEPWLQEYVQKVIQYLSKEGTD